MDIPGKPRSNLCSLPAIMFSVTLQEYHQVIISALWMVILSIIPPDLVRIGALLVGGIICICDIMNAMRPQVLMKKLQLRLLILEGKLRDTVDSGIIYQSDTNFAARIETNMGRWACVSFHEIIYLRWPRQPSIQDLRAPREDAFDVGGDSTRDKGCLEGSLTWN